jgi:hypothetical protein
LLLDPGYIDEAGNGKRKKEGQRTTIVCFFTIMFYFILRDCLEAGRTARLESACQTGKKNEHQNINEKTCFLPRCAPFANIICTYTKLKSFPQFHKITSSSTDRLIRPTTNAHISHSLRAIYD